MKTLINLWKYRFTLYNLIMKDFKIRYRNMALGFLWSLINPLVMVGILTFVFTMMFPGRQRALPVFLLVAIIPYNFLSISLSGSTTSIIDNTSLVKRVVFPRQILPMAIILSNLIHFFIQSGILIIFILAFHIAPNIYWFSLPIFFAIQLVFIAGICMMCAALDVYYRDVRYIVESGLTVFFWLSPVLYPISYVPEKFLNIYLLNPMAGLITCYRDIILEGKLPDLFIIQRALIAAIAFFVLGAVIFWRCERNFSDLI